jgi:nucleotide-binding universal stress UspA family protein
MKTIVTPLDGSALAEQALPYTRLLASLLGASVKLVRSVTPDEMQAVLERIAALPERARRLDTDLQHEHQAIDELTRRATAYLADQAQHLHEAGLRVTTTTGVGPPAEAIAEIARSESDVLIVMATHGYSGLRRWTLGSVADQVIHAATIPVLLVRVGVTAPEPIGLRRILVPLDGSGLARQALPVAVELATRARAELILLQVVVPPAELGPVLAMPGRPLAAATDMLTPERAQVQQHLSGVAEQLARPNVTITALAPMGEPAEAIVRQAAECRADLIVMATHGRSGIRRWLRGSVADKVLHATSTPLLLVRAQEA